MAVAGADTVSVAQELTESEATVLAVRVTLPRALAVAAVEGETLEDDDAESANDNVRGLEADASAVEDAGALALAVADPCRDAVGLWEADVHAESVPAGERVVGGERDVDAHADGQAEGESDADPRALEDNETLLEAEAHDEKDGSVVALLVGKVGNALRDALVLALGEEVADALRVDRADADTDRDTRGEREVLPLRHGDAVPDGDREALALRDALRDEDVVAVPERLEELHADVVGKAVGR